MDEPGERDTDRLRDLIESGSQVMELDQLPRKDLDALLFGLRGDRDP